VGFLRRTLCVCSYVVVTSFQYFFCFFSFFELPVSGEIKMYIYYRVNKDFRFVSDRQSKLAATSGLGSVRLTSLQPRKIITSNKLSYTLGVNFSAHDQILLVQSELHGGRRGRRYLAY